MAPHNGLERLTRLVAKRRQSVPRSQAPTIHYEQLRKAFCGDGTGGTHGCQGRRVLDRSRGRDTLRVAPSTGRRWIREGDVSAYRLGQRRIGLRRGDLASLITPVHAEREGMGDASFKETITRRLTPEEKRRGLEAMARMKVLSDEILAERGGKPFSNSWELIY